MAETVPLVTLNNGVKMPILGLGTWRIENNTACDVIKKAIDIGYRHVDEAYIYMNEQEVGQAIKEKIADGTVSRDDLFIVSKLWSTFRTRERVFQACKKSLELFALDYFDLYLMHLPIAFKQTDETIFPFAEDGSMMIDDDIDYLESWKAMEELVDAGLCKSIGVSNFSVKQVKRLLENCRIKPVINQVECHPYFNRKQFIQEHRDLGVAVTAYCPLASPDRNQLMDPKIPQLLDNPILKEVGDKYGKSPAQIAIRFQIDRDVSVVPKSASEKNLKSNFDIFDFKLSSEDLEKINGLDSNGELMAYITSCKHSKYYPK